MNANFLIHRTLLVTTSLLFLTCANANNAKSSDLNTQQDEALMGSYTIENYADKLSFPKSLTVLSDDTLLVAQRDGVVDVITTDKQQKRFRIPLPLLYTKGQGGLLDLLVIEEVSTGSGILSNVILLASYAKGNDDSNKLAVVKTTLSIQDGFSDVTPIYEVNEAKDTPVHYGGKLLALHNGEGFLVTTGDGFDYREKAQVVSSHLGKVIGFTLQGAPLASPPISESPYIFSLGHRNPQGLVYGADGNIYLHEHGPDGGDELNRLEPGANYGWPVVTLGKDYSGASISPFSQYEGMLDPLIDWTPSIAPSSMHVYSHSAFEGLHNAFLVTSLKAKQLFAIVREEETLSVYAIVKSLAQRLRDVEVDSLGNIFILTDGENGKVVKVSPR